VLTEDGDIGKVCRRKGMARIPATNHATLVDTDSEDAQANTKLSASTLQ
jgi:hypothetical protein